MSGWMTMDLDHWQRLVDGAAPDGLKNLEGVSPGGAAARLRVSRQAIHDAINRGKLDAIRITLKGQLAAIIVTDASLEAYEKLRELRSA